MLRELSAGLTQSSVPKFAAKIRDLLYERGERQYQEIKAELGVGAMLVGNASPISFEPYTSPTAAPHERNKSPDYGIWLPDGVVAVEVTVFHVGALDAWERLIRTVQRDLGSRIRASQAKKIISMSVPLEVPSLAASRFVTRDVTNTILSNESGRLEVPVPNGMAEIEWQPMPVVRAPRDEWNTDAPAAVFVDAPDGIVDPVRSAHAFKVQPTWDPQRFEDLVFRAMQATLKRKRDQLRAIEEPCVIAMQAGHHRISDEMIVDIVERQVLVQPEVRLDHGHHPIRSRKAYSEHDAERKLLSTLNPNAVRQPAPRSSNC